MTAELTALTLAALFQAVQFLAYSVTAQRQVGTGYALSPRDTPRVLSGLAGRLQRAMNNHFEALILFAIAALVIAVSGQSSDFTAACAWVFLAARLLYLPAYALGLVPWRSLVWCVGFLASMAMLGAALV